jgi:hypothetical protein
MQTDLEMAVVERKSWCSMISQGVVEVSLQWVFDHDPAQQPSLPCNLEVGQEVVDRKTYV